MEAPFGDQLSFIVSHRVRGASRNSHSSQHVEVTPQAVGHAVLSNPQPVHLGAQAEDADGGARPGRPSLPSQERAPSLPTHQDGPGVSAEFGVRAESPRFSREFIIDSETSCSGVS